MKIFAIPAVVFCAVVYIVVLVAICDVTHESDINGKITIKTSTGKQKKLTKLTEFLEFKGKDPGLANPCVRTNRNNGGKQDA